jgi:hypothetical protein
VGCNVNSRLFCPINADLWSLKQGQGRYPHCSFIVPALLYQTSTPTRNVAKAARSRLSDSVSTVLVWIAIIAMRWAESMCWFMQ